MKKKTLLLAALLGLGTLNMGAKDFYEFDNVTAESILNLFLQAKQEGHNYPTLDEFASIGISAADIEFIRSHVRRNELVNPDDHLYPDIYKDRKAFMCFPMGNGSQGAHGYPTNEMGKTDAWTMWNYTSNFGSWNHGFFQAPGSWADAAHKNGSRLMSGMYFFESAFGGADDTPWVNFISKKEDDGTYTYVEPMINALMYFGHDGIVYNWEAYNYKDPNVVAFHKALYKKAWERNFTDYNSLIYVLNSSLSSGNAPVVYGTKDEPIHELFLNYMSGMITTMAPSSYEYAANTAGDASRLYAGVHIVDIANRNWTELEEDGAEKINLIMWGEHTCNQLYSHTSGTEPGEWQKNYQWMQERFFSGGNGNPANLPTGDPDAVSYPGIGSFVGLAKYMPERSAVSHQFLTHFNLGNGEFYYDKGVKTTVGGWYNMASQDLVPTYRWLVYDAGTTNAGSGVRPSFTHEDAYVGGSCLKLEATANAGGSDIILYKTGIKLTGVAKAAVAVRRLSGDGELSLLLKVDGAWKEYPVSAITSEWGEKPLDLSGVSGTIERVGFRVKGNGQLLVGKLEVSGDKTVQPAKIKELVSAESVSESETDVTLKLYWTVDGKVDEYGRSYNEDNNIDHFEIFIMKDGKEVEVGRTSQWATIAAHLPFAADAEQLKVGVRSVSTDLRTASPIVWKEVQKGQPDEVINPDDTSGQGPYYQVNFNKKAPHEREDRYVMHVGVYDYDNNGDGALQQYPDNDLTARITKQFYLDKTDEVVFNLTVGKAYRPYIAYHGLWMSGFAYIDWNNDGVFNATEGITFDDYGRVTRADDHCELVSFSAYRQDEDKYWYNSNRRYFDSGTEFPKENNVKKWMGWFKVPADAQPGIYRMRFKLDWNNFDAGGSDEIRKDGGDIVDVLVNVQPSDGMVKVGAKAQNGTVEMGALKLDETMNGKAAANNDLAVTLTPSTGYSVAGVTVQHGYNFDNASGVDKVGNRQWWIEKEQVTTSAYTVPAKSMNGNVLITPVFLSTDGIDTIQVTEADMQANDIYNLNGQLVRRAGSKRQLPRGVYVMKGRKVVL
ncbi:MAG: glycosyl hydrolase family 85 [Prevotella sp.]|nr:glycosyl hydrolase family 85 [Prevotella sp.]